MKRKEKAERIQAMLEELYPETPVPLDHESPFQLLIAVLMSAQTTDLKVNQVTPELFRQGSTPEKMASLEVSTIQSLIREVGPLPRQKTSAACRNCCWNVMEERFQTPSMNLKRSLALDTKPLELFLPKHLAFQPSRLILTSTDLLPDGGCRMGGMLTKRKKISKQFSRKKHGTICICKSSSLAGNTALQGTMICLNAQSVHGPQQKNESQKRRR